MITDVEIEGLRGIRSGSLTGFGPLVVLVGPNGCGKSTVLDALLIGANVDPGGATGRVVQRRIGSWNGSRWLFARQGVRRIASLGVVAAVGGSKAQTWRTTLELGAPAWLEDSAPLQQRGAPEPFITTKVGSDGRDLGNVVFSGNNDFLSYSKAASTPRLPIRLVDAPGSTNAPLDEVYTAAVETGRKHVADTALREVLGGNVRGVTLLTDHRVPVIHLEYEDGSVPVSLAGEGVASLVRIALELAGRPDGVVLLEEPEAHQHPRLIWQTAALIWATLARGVQVILSTHSLELLDALLANAPAGKLDDLGVYRLQLEAGDLRYTRYSGSQASTQRLEFEDDLR